jgi:putative hydrolase of the HAD superfamily
MRPGLMRPSLIAWDFDGVLNRNCKGGDRAWDRSFEADLGVSAKDFDQFMFRSGRFNDVLVGKRDVLDLLGQWIAEFKVPYTASAVLDYWLAKDTDGDAEVLGWVHAANVKSVIATNNEARRSAYIWDHLGYRARMAQIFAAGSIGVRKPDAEFYSQIEDWAGLPPEQILLVDDAEANIAAAHRRGWMAFHFTDTSRHRLPGLLGIAR